MQFACRELQELFSKLPKDWLLKCSVNSNGYFRVHLIASCLQTINSCQEQGEMGILCSNSDGFMRWTDSGWIITFNVDIHGPSV